jgi:hypothetical protein
MANALIDAGSVPGELTLALSGIGGNRRSHRRFSRGVVHTVACSLTRA